MDFCKDNNMFRCLSFETLLDYLLQGIYLSKMEKEILFTADKLSSIKNKFIESDFYFDRFRWICHTNL